MTKTIEELAKQYAEDMCPVGDYCGVVYDEQRNCDLPIYIDDAKSVLTWMFDKPIRDRLTAEEKEIVRKVYKAMSDYGKKKDVMCADCANYAARVCMERIFGAEMFNEKEK